jgi:predicted MFS family arabinose efflux permease
MMKFKALLPLYAVIFLGFVGYALTITLFIPMLMNTTFPLLPSDTSVATRASLSGFLLAMYPLGQFFGSPVIGNLSDHFGRKKVLLLSLVACFFGFIGMALSIHYYQLIFLFISSFVTGLFESNMAISQSVIADKVTDTVQKTRLIGYAYSACSLGWIVGASLGGIGGTALGYSAPFEITALGVLCLLAWIFYSFEEPLLSEQRASIHILKSLTAVKSILNNPSLYKIYAINFLIFFSVQGLYRVVPLYVIDEWQPSLHTYSLLIAFISFLCFLSNLTILEKLAKRFSPKVLLTGLVFIGGVLIIMIVIPPSLHWIWITFGLAVIPTVMALPTCTTWLSEQAKTAEQGQVLGNNQALLVLAEATSAAVGGVIAAIWIPLPVILLGIILLVTGIILLYMQEHSN